jgi:hypothetical protein
MKKNRFFLFIIFVLSISATYAQLGIRAGLNMANEITTLSNLANSFKTDNLTGYHIGLVYEFNPKKSGFGSEFGILISQKGCSFTDSTSVTDQILTGYDEINYLELPVNVRYRLKLGFLAIYGSAGMYAGYALSGQTTLESTEETTSGDINFANMIDHLDYGVQLGVGLELLKKIQLGLNYSYGLKSNNYQRNIDNLSAAINNRVFSISLTYLF